MYELIFGVRDRAFERSLLSSIAPLAELLRPNQPIPDFFNSASPRFGDALAEVLGASVHTVRAQTAALGTTSPWLRSFARGDARSRLDLRAAFHSYYQSQLAPQWDQVVQTFDGEVRARARQAFSDGLGTLLGTLHPDVQWSSPVLTVASSFDGDVHLNGRGLTLVPLVHTQSGPAMCTVPRPMLLYPATAAPTTGVSLEGALGRTRTEVLRALTTERSTTDLARYVGISLPTASQHATALRGAGFVTTQRDGRAVKHRLTQRGWELLN